MGSLSREPRRSYCAIILPESLCSTTPASHSGRSGLMRNYRFLELLRQTDDLGLGAMR